MDDNSSFDVVIPAAGVGSRLGASIPKQYLKLGSKTILEHTLQIFLKASFINQVIVVISKEDSFFEKLGLFSPKLQIAIGGKERADSVKAGLKYVKSAWVLVHDAARPLLTEDDLINLIEKGTKTDCGAILAAPVADTLKKADDNLNISTTVSRRSMYRALTPQLFKTELLIKALSLNEGSKEITDEASAVESLGYKPLLVPGRSDNLKITDKTDLQIATALFWFLQQSNSIGNN